jgi:chromosome segregation ATPase
MSTLEATIAELTAERARLDADRAQHTAELERIDRQLAAADLNSDPLQLAGARVRRDQLAGAIAQIDQRAAHLEAKLEPAQQQQSGQAARLSHDRRLIAALRSPQGLAHPHLRSIPASALPGEVERARTRLERAGETVGKIKLTL